jgi:hypothetical protein
MAMGMGKDAPAKPALSGFKVAFHHTKSPPSLLVSIQVSFFVYFVTMYVVKVPTIVFNFFYYA